jgi:hypothetical protein
MSATRLVHALAGHPTPEGSAAATLGPHAGTCAVCGLPTDRTASVDRALGANFTNRSMFHDDASDRVCAACLWCCSGKPPATLRMWSIVAAPGHDLGPSHEKAFLQDTPGLLLTNRANPGPIADWLAFPPPTGPWVVSIAVSGQKHVVPYARVNHGRDTWTIRYENTDVTANPEQWAAVHAAAATLRRLGVPADDVLTGTPRYLKTATDLAAWREHNTTLTPYHGSPLLALALWTITKGTLA